MSEFGSFSDLANVKGNTIEKPKPLPTGHYSVIITGPFKEHKAKSGNFAMRFPLKIVEPLSDVDVDALESAGKAREREYTIDFWMSPDARWRFTEFCKSLGISDEQDLISMAEELVSKNEPFMLECRHEQNQDKPEEVYARLDNPAPLSAFQG